MSATIWIDTSTEKTIELGPTIPMYKAFSEMTQVASEEKYKEHPELFTVPSQTEDTADCDPIWLRRVRQQASSFLSEYRDQLSSHTRWILEQLIG